MASYIPSVTDTPQSLQSPVYTPDYSFLSNELQKSNQQYGQGLQKVANDYSAITSQQVTNGENQQKQQEYIAKIQEGLKKIAPTDLSLPQNVSQAESLYQPFWKDADMLADIGITKDVNAKLGQAEGDRTNTDEKIRTTYNPYSVARQKYVLEDLKNAKRGDGSISSVQRADYVPITDYQAYVDAQDKASDFKGITKERINGPYMIKETNGVGVLPQLRTRYDDMLGTKFQAQFSQQGWVEHRQELDQLARQFPEIPRDQLNQKLAETKYHQIADNYKSRIEATTNDIHTTFQLPIDAINEQIRKQGGKATDTQKQNLKNLTDGYNKPDGTAIPGINYYNQKLAGIQYDSEQFSKANPNEKISAISINPDNYYGQLARQTTVEKLANVQATNYKMDIELNKVWDAVATHEEAKTNIRMRGAELGEKKQNDLWEHQDRMNRVNADLTISGIDSATGEKIGAKAGTGVDNGHVLGENITDQQHIDFANVLAAQKNGFLARAAEASFGTGGSADVLSALGVSDNDLLQYKTQMKRLYSNYSDPGFKQKPEEITAFNNIRAKLSGYLGHPVANTYKDVISAQNEYIASQLKVRGSDLKNPMTPDDPFAQAFTRMNAATDALNGYQGKVNEEKSVLTHLSLSDRTNNHIILNDAGTGFAGVSDVAKYSPTLQVTDKYGNAKTITPQEYAESYLNKAVKHTGSDEIILNGNKYHVNQVNGVDNNNYSSGYGDTGTKSLLDMSLDKTMGRFGAYDKRDEANQRIQNSVASLMPSVRDHTGKTGMNISYSFGTEKLPGNGERMIQESLNPSNSTEVRFQGDKDPLSDADMVKLKALAGSASEIRKNLGQPTYSTVSSTGQDVVRFTVNDWDGKGAGKIIEIPLSPHVTGDFLSQVPKSNDLYVYNKLSKGEIISSDNTWESMGVKYSVIPDNADRPNTATAKIEHIEVDPKTGTEHWVSDAPISINLTGPRSANPDLIMGAVTNKALSHISILAKQRATWNTNNAR